MSKGLEAALLFCCCIAKYYKLRGLKQHIFTVSQFLCLRVWAQLDWCLCSGFHKATVECWLDCIFIWRPKWGRIHSQAPLGRSCFQRNLSVQWEGEVTSTSPLWQPVMQRAFLPALLPKNSSRVLGPALISFTLQTSGVAMPPTIPSS